MCGKSKGSFRNWKTRKTLTEQSLGEPQKERATKLCEYVVEVSMAL